MVYEVQKKILADLTCKLPGLSAIIYFTDGCDGQYKNWKKKLYLPAQKRFWTECEMGIFCQYCSHGKQPCDGIGGTVQRLASNASLKSDLKYQIMLPMIYFNFAWKIFKILSSILFPRIMLITQG